jgi:glycosyltransferase involved in cell wall biosynthesis/GT2 family glycosyltransferase
MTILRIAHHAVVSQWRQRERELRSLGVDVRLVSARKWNEGGRTITLDPEHDDFTTGAGTIGRHPSVFLYNPFAIWRAVGRRPDLIDLHEEPNSLATAQVLATRWFRRSRSPYVLYSAQNIEKRYPLPFRWIERRSLKSASGAYVCNVEAGQILRKKGLGGAVFQIPLGVDVRVFAPRERHELRKTKVIGYVGRLEAHKGVDVLLRALATRDDWHSNIVGEGPDRGELERLATDLGIASRVRFLGYSSGSSLAENYRGMDVLAVTSLPRPNWLEQFCRVAVEAMASGVPVVASRSGAIPDVIGEAGILVSPGDPVALASGLADALEPSRWIGLRARGLERAQDFTWENVARMHREMYEAVLGLEVLSARNDPAVLVVAYGPPDGLDACLSALNGEFPVTVVDNSSLPETRDVAERHGAHYIDAVLNIGFAAGVNLGLAAIGSSQYAQRDLLLLNPDARIAPSGVRQMHASAYSGPRIAAVGATQTDPQTGAEVKVWWPFPTPFGAWIEAIGFGSLRPTRGFAIGSALLLRRAAIELVGRLDEEFFLYAEETDWQLRARRLGWSIEVARVEATHEGGGTGGDPRLRESHFYASAERYIRKHYGRSGWQVYRAGTLVGASVRGLLLRGDRGHAARRRRDLFARGPVSSLRDLLARQTS